MSKVISDIIAYNLYDIIINLYNMSDNLAQNTDQLITELRNASQSSPLEGIDKIYEKYSYLINFIFDSNDSLTKKKFNGESGFIGNNVEYDGHKLFMEIKKTDTISTGDFCYFSVDLLDFLIKNLDEVCASNTEVIGILSNFTYRYKFGNRDTTYDNLVSQYRKLRELKEESNEPIFDSSESNILLLQYFTTMKNFFKVMGSHIMWDSEPNVGDYVTFHVGRNRYENNEEFDIVCKITERIYNDSFDTNVYDYDILSYNSKLLDKYPDYWLFKHEDEEKYLEPIHSSYLTIHSERPF